MKSIQQAVTEILARGTRVVSFKYNDKVRNVLIGSNAAGQPAPWGENLNRALRVHQGRTYLIGIDNNDERGRSMKTFSLDKIQNFSMA